MKIYANTITNINPVAKNQQGSVFSAKNTTPAAFADNKPANSGLIDYLSFTGAINQASIVKPNSIHQLIKDLIDFKGDNFEFAKYSFNKIKKHFGFEDLIKDDIHLVDRYKGNDFEAQFSSKTGEFEIDKITCLNLTRCEIASVIRHEFEHFLQAQRMFRHEDIGIGKCLKKDILQITELFDNEAYVLNQKVDPKQRQKFIDENSNNFEGINMDFWNKIISTKGILKKDDPEAKLAKKEFEKLYSHKIYINFNKFDAKDRKALPIWQTTTYYDNHNIGNSDNYWTQPLEIAARKVEENFLKQYLKVSKESYSPSEQKFKDTEEFESIQEFMKSMAERFKNNNLPNLFKGYIYDKLTSNILNDKSIFDSSCSLQHIKEVTANVKSLSDDTIKNYLSLFKYRLDNGTIRLYNKKETDNFLKFAENFEKSTQ